LRRRNVSVRPGFGFAAAASSSDVSNHASKDPRSSIEGCSTLGGGMVLVRSFRTTFSQISALEPGLATSASSNIKPAVLSFALWQVTQ
jgi:hypothetical protein